MLEDTVPETVTQIGTRQGDNDPAGLTGVALCLICCRAVELICFLQEADSLLWLLHCNVYPECPWPLINYDSSGPLCLKAELRGLEEKKSPFSISKRD